MGSLVYRLKVTGLVSVFVGELPPTLGGWSSDFHLLMQLQECGGFRGLQKANEADRPACSLAVRLAVWV